MYTLKENAMKHTIIYGLSAIMMLSLFGGCGGSGNSTPTEAAQAQANNTQSTNSIPPAETRAEKKKNKKRMQLSADPGIDEILLHWEPVKKTTTYKLRWGISKDAMDETFTFNADETQFLHTGLEPATLYYYRIIAKRGKKKKRVSKVLEVRTGDREKITQSDVAY